jgi:hypothetical protein
VALFGATFEFAFTCTKESLQWLFKMLIDTFKYISSSMPVTSFQSCNLVD